MATSVKMSSKHQIVVPKEAREALRLEPGDRLVVTVRADGVIEMEREPRDLVGELSGILEYATAPRPGTDGDDRDGGERKEGLWAELRDA